MHAVVSVVIFHDDFHSWRDHEVWTRSNV